MVTVILKDKRVCKMLHSKGIMDADIYDSPIHPWFIFLLLISPLIYPISLYFYIKYAIFFVPYFIFSYLLNAYHNNSFALYEDKLIVINSNFPFRNLKIIEIKDIQKITIDEGKGKWIWMLCLLFGNNYLNIEMGEKTETYYCSALQVDCYDENWIEKTMDDFECSLKEKGIEVDFRLE